MSLDDVTLGLGHSRIDVTSDVHDPMLPSRSREVPTWLNELLRGEG
jgi:hypothetical protein